MPLHSKRGEHSHELKLSRVNRTYVLPCMGLSIATCHGPDEGAWLCRAGQEALWGAGGPKRHRVGVKIAVMRHGGDGLSRGDELPHEWSSASWWPSRGRGHAAMQRNRTHVHLHIW